MFKSVAIIAVIASVVSAQTLVPPSRTIIRPNPVTITATVTTTPPHCETPVYSTLCPELCVTTSTLTLDKLCPPADSYKYCPPTVTQTEMSRCPFCPVARCATLFTRYEVAPCTNLPKSCPPAVETVSIKCPYEEYPWDY